MEKRILSLDVSDKKIRYVYIDKQGRTMKITKAGKVDVTIDLTAEGSLSKAINDLIVANSMAPQRICVSLSFKDSVVHQLTIPKMSKAELHEVISGEIEKIPSLSEHNYDYILHDYPLAGEKYKVVLSAIPESLLKFVRREVAVKGAILQHMEVMPLNLKEIAAKINPKEQYRSMLVVHDHVTYLSLYHNQDYRLLYKISIGAEQLGSPDSDLVQEVAFANWLAEIRRVLKSFLLDNAHIKIQTLWLVCDCDRLSNLEARLQETLNYRVESMTLDKIPHVDVDEKIAANSIYVVPFLPAYCAMNNMKVDFPLDHFFRAQHIKEFMFKTMTTYAVAVGVIAVLIGSVGVNFHQKRSALLAEKATMTQEITGLQSEAAQLYEEESEYKQVREALLAQATYVQMLNRVSWSQVFFEVSQELPENLALSRFKFSEGGQAQIEGDAMEMEKISELIRKVETSAILEKGRFDFLKGKEIKEVKLFTFGIFAKLKETGLKDVESRNE